MQDINADGKEEIIVTLLKETGMGCYVEELHVLNKESLTEIMIGNPLDFINKKTNSQIVQKDNNVSVIIKWEDKKLEKTYKKTDAGIWNEKVAFGQTIYYMSIKLSQKTIASRTYVCYD